MKAFFFVLGLFALCQTPALAQTPTPVNWSFALADQGGNEYLLTATAAIDDEWYLYSQDNDGTGPVPTAFTFTNGTTLGKTLELSDRIEEYSDLFEIEVKKFKNKAAFTQRLKMSADAKMVSGSVVFMCCDGEKCLPPTTVQFDLGL